MVQRARCRRHQGSAERPAKHRPRLPDRRPRRREGVMTSPIKLSAWQRRALAVPNDVQLHMWVGGRSGGKTFAACVSAVLYADKYKQRVLFVRRTERALSDLA